MMIAKSSMQTSKGKIQYHTSGSGQPNIVLINGGSGPVEGWMKVLSEVARWGTVFAYNRLGVAGSNKPQEPQDGLTIVETLREALTIAGIKPPYLLVGHSLGGLYANLYARLYPDEAEGVVFLEASHPGDLRLNDYQGKFVKTLNKMLAMFDSLSPHKQFAEVRFVQRTADQIREAGPFPEVPVYVITGGKENRMMPEEVRRIRMDNQADLLSLSGDSTRVIAEKSGHFPQLTEPRVVIDTIKACVERIRQINDVPIRSSASKP